MIARQPKIKKPSLMMHPKWRVISLSVMATSLVFLSIAVSSTHWRIDHEPWIDVLSTLGMWRICRDIKFGATLDHKCLTSLPNNAPAWYQVTRGFLSLGLLFEFIAFAVAIKIITSIPIPTPETIKSNLPQPRVNMVIPLLLMFCASVVVLIGVSTFAVATHLERALYFPPNLPPTWADSWAQVWAKRQSQPQNRVKYNEMTMSYGYSFGFAWASVLSSMVSWMTIIASRS